KVLQRRLHGLAGDTLLLEIVTNGRVAVSALCERLDASSREAGVVEESRPSEHFQRLLRSGRSDRGPLEPLGQAPRGQVPPPQGVGGHRERLRTTELAAQEPQRGSVEGAALGEADPGGNVDRDDSPRRAVQLDGDATGPLAAQRRDRRHYFAAAFSTGSSVTLPFRSAASAGARSRAEATCSAPSSV